MAMMVMMAMISTIEVTTVMRVTTVMMIPTTQTIIIAIMRIFFLLWDDRWGPKANIPK